MMMTNVAVITFTSCHSFCAKSSSWNKAKIVINWLRSLNLLKYRLIIYSFLFSYRFSSRFELPLLVQSIVMSVAMFLMIHLCVKVKRNNAIMKTRDRVFSGNVELVFSKSKGNIKSQTLKRLLNWISSTINSSPCRKWNICVYINCIQRKPQFHIDAYLRS